MFYEKTIFILIMLVLLLSSSGCLSNETPSSDFEYTKVSGGMEITKYTENSKNVVVPSVIDEQRVVSVGEAFSGNTALESITLSENITSLEGKSFWGCDALKSLYAPGAVETSTLSLNSIEVLSIPKAETVCLYQLKSAHKLREPNISVARHILAYSYSSNSYCEPPALEKVSISE